MLIRRTFRTALAAAAFTGMASLTAVQAQDARAPGVRAASPEVVERAPNGRPISVRIDGVIYKVCMSERDDGCIQPRAAGLNWGDRPLQHWPGQPASQMNGPARTPSR